MQSGFAVCEGRKWPTQQDEQNHFHPTRISGANVGQNVHVPILRICRGILPMFSHTTTTLPSLREHCLVWALALSSTIQECHRLALLASECFPSWILQPPGQGCGHIATDGAITFVVLVACMLGSWMSKCCPPVLGVDEKSRPLAAVRVKQSCDSSAGAAGVRSPRA